MLLVFSKTTFPANQLHNMHARQHQLQMRVRFCVKQVRNTCKCRWKQSFVAFCGANLDNTQKRWSLEAWGVDYVMAWRTCASAVAARWLSCCPPAPAFDVVVVKRCAYAPALRWAPCITLGRRQTLVLPLQRPQSSWILVCAVLIRTDLFAQGPGSEFVSKPSNFRLPRRFQPSCPSQPLFGATDTRGYRQHNEDIFQLHA